MRQPGGMKYIVEAIKLMSLQHEDHIKDYDPTSGADNARRLTGLHETASWVLTNFCRTSASIKLITFNL